METVRFRFMLFGWPTVCCQILSRRSQRASFPRIFHESREVPLGRCRKVSRGRNKNKVKRYKINTKNTIFWTFRQLHITQLVEWNKFSAVTAAMFAQLPNRQNFYASDTIKMITSGGKFAARWTADIIIYHSPESITSNVVPRERKNWMCSPSAEHVKFNWIFLCSPNAHIQYIRGRLGGWVVEGTHGPPIKLYFVVVVVFGRAAKKCKKMFPM